MKVLSPFQRRLNRISLYGIPACFVLLDETERAECALNTSIPIPELKMVFLIHGDIVSSDAALCGFP